MTKLSLDQRLVVARVLTRYLDQGSPAYWDRGVLAALEKWIEEKSERVAS